MRRPRGTGSLFKKPGSRIWWIKYYRGGVPVRESTGTANKITAGDTLKDKIAPTLQALAGPRIGRMRIAELADGLLRDYRVNARKSLASTELRWTVHLEPVFGRMRACDLSTECLNRYVDQRKAEGAENGTVNRELAALKRAFYLGFRCSPRKVQSVPTFPHLKESAPRSGFVEDGDYNKLCDSSRGELWLRTLLALAYTFGFRKSELLNLRVRQTDLLNRSIVLDVGSTKSGAGRVVKMTNEVYELLRASLSGKAPDDLLFTRGKEPVLDFRGAWYSLCERASLGGWVKGPDEKEHWQGLIFHDLRRSAVRNMVRRGVSEKVAMMISGHKTRSVFDRYNIIDESDLADASRRIEQGARAHPEFGHSTGTVEAEQSGKDVVKSM